MVPIDTRLDSKVVSDRCPNGFKMFPKILYISFFFITVPMGTQLVSRVVSHWFPNGFEMVPPLFYISVFCIMVPRCT
jgi:hypothetical protein